MWVFFWILVAIEAESLTGPEPWVEEDLETNNLQSFTIIWSFPLWLQHWVKVPSINSDNRVITPVLAFIAPPLGLHVLKRRIFLRHHMEYLAV